MGLTRAQLLADAEAEAQAAYEATEAAYEDGSTISRAHFDRAIELGRGRGGAFGPAYLEAEKEFATREAENEAEAKAAAEWYHEASRRAELLR